MLLTGLSASIPALLMNDSLIREFHLKRKTGLVSPLLEALQDLFFIPRTYWVCTLSPSCPFTSRLFLWPLWFSFPGLQPHQTAFLFLEGTEHTHSFLRTSALFFLRGMLFLQMLPWLCLSLPSGVFQTSVSRRSLPCPPCMQQHALPPESDSTPHCFIVPHGICLSVCLSVLECKLHEAKGFVLFISVSPTSRALPVT